MNIQTEHLENNIARFTVEVAVERVEDAKKKAARKIAKQVNIPGFRKGKAPYNMIERYVGAAAILEEAIEMLGQEIYRETLDESGIEPYGPGQLEDFKLDPEPQFIYTVPKVPSVELNDYRSVRVEYAAPEVSDEDVDQQIKSLLQQEAVVEESEKPIEVGNRVTFDIDSYFTDTDTAADEAKSEEAEDQDGDEDDDYDEEDDNIFIVREGLKADLNEGDDEPIAPGFTAALVGASAGDVRTFDLTFPDNDDIDEEVRGRTVHFEVNIKNVETMTMPELNDEFSARFTDRFATAEDEQDEEGNPLPLTLVQLRQRIREGLERNAEEQTNNEYADKVLDEMVKVAETNFPEVMIHDQIHQMIDQLDQQLRNQGMSLEMYQQITGKSHNDLHEDYHESAEQMIRRSLVLSQVVIEEKIRISDADIDEHIANLARQFGGGEDQIEMIMNSLNTSAMRSNIVNRIVQDKAFERIIAIGKGDAPELTEEETDKDETVDAADAETAEAVTADEAPEVEGTNTAETSSSSEAVAENSTEESAADSDDSSDESPDESPDESSDKS